MQCSAWLGQLHAEQRVLTHHPSHLRVAHMTASERDGRRVVHRLHDARAGHGGEVPISRADEDPAFGYEDP